MAIAYAGSLAGGNVVSGTDPTLTTPPGGIGHLWLVYCMAVGNANLTPTCTDNNTGGTWTRIFAIQKNGGADTLSCFVRDNLFVNTTSTTVTIAIGAHTAVQACIVAASGVPVGGIAAIIQSATTANGTAGGTPSTTFTNPPSPFSITFSGVGNSTNPAGVSINSGPATWISATNTGQVGVGLGIQYAFGSPATIPWGGTSATTFAAGAVEVGVVPSGAGVDVSKLVAYTFEAPATGVNVSKLLGYMLPGAVEGVDVSKLLGYMLVASVNSNPPVWPNITFPDGIVGVPYNTNWDLTPAAAPTTYTTVVGIIPPGTTLNSPSQDLGNITGTPTLAGTYVFTLRASNLYGIADKQFTIVIRNPAAIVPGFASASHVYIT